MSINNNTRPLIVLLFFAAHAVAIMSLAMRSWVFILTLAIGVGVGMLAALICWASAAVFHQHDRKVARRAAQAQERASEIDALRKRAEKQDRSLTYGYLNMDEAAIMRGIYGKYPPVDLDNYGDAEGAP